MCRGQDTVRTFGRGVGALAGLAILSFGAAQAGAQTLDSGSGLVASQKLSTTPGEDYGTPPLPAPEALVPSLNRYLKQFGTALLVDNVDEFDSIVHARSTGTTNAGQVGVEWDQDWNTLAHIPGLETHAIVIGRYGAMASHIFGDTLNGSQEVYGVGGNVVAHLVFAYAEETLAQGHFALAAGRFPPQNDFDSSPLNCNFQSNTLCGNPKAFAENSANASYPESVWGTRLRVRPISPLYIEAGLFFPQDNTYVATFGDRSNFNFDTNHIDGEFVPTEIGYEPSLGRDKLPGHYKVGFAYDSTNHADDYLDQNGAPFALSGLAPGERKGGTIAWIDADQMVRRQGPGPTDGIILKGGYSHQDPRYSMRTGLLYGLMLDRHFWNARPFDTVGLLASYTQVSGQLTKTEELQQELGLPITGNGGNGGQFYDGYHPGIQTSAMVFEANYQIHLFRGVTFAPDFQYFLRPNAQENNPNAVLIGFKSHIELF